MNGSRNRSAAASQRLPLRIGVSRCLLGDEVRYDGGHKRSDFLVDVLGPYVEWVPVCPEVEAGMGTPREPIHLIGKARQPRVQTVKSRQDVTQMMVRFSERKVRELKDMGLSGYVFKHRSPSCGMERVPVYSEHGVTAQDGVGIFARAFMERFPLIPVEEEGRLCDPVQRENFIERIFSYRRWQALLNGPVTRQAVVDFHTVHTCTLLAHSRAHYESLDRLVAEAYRYRPAELFQQYGATFMDAMRVKATIPKHVKVLRHMVRHFRTRLRPTEQAELNRVIQDYHRGLVPLLVPLTLVKHYVRIFGISELRHQVYLNPHPQELMLRNRV